MKAKPTLVNALGKSFFKLFLIVFLLLIFVFSLGFIKAYRGSILSDSQTISTLKKREILELISRDSDSARISLNYSLAGMTNIDRFVIFSSNGIIVHDYFISGKITPEPNTPFQMTDELVAKINLSHSTVSGPIHLGGKTFAYFKIFFANDLLDEYFYSYLSAITACLLIIYFLFSWILRRSSTAFRHSIKKISVALDSQNIDELDSDQNLSDLKDIIASHQTLLSELRDSQSQLDEAALVSKTNIHGKITYVNSKFCEISQYSMDELLGQNHQMLQSGEHSKVFWQDFWNHIKTANIWRGEICNLNKSGGLFWVQATILPLFDSQAEIVGYCAIKIDITTKKETQKKMQHQSKLASIGELAAGVGHEINNPLAICVGHMELIKKELESKSINVTSLERRLEKTSEGHERIRKIVDGLRTYARSDTDHSNTILVNDAINQTLNLISEIYEGEGIQLTKDICDKNIFMLGNLGKLQQILMNFLSNSKDATENLSSRTIHVSLNVSKNNYFVISVSDNGTGIPENIQSRILTPFFTTKDHGKGTGLGLSVANELIKLMAGQLRIESSMGKGSQFLASFPMAEAPNLSNSTATLKTKIVTELKGRALVVDDEPDIRELLVEYLSALGLQVDAADDGLTALEMVKKTAYDFICSDMKMTHMHGDEFIQQAKTLPFGDTKYFIITGGISTHYSKEKRNHLRDLADGYITKPFSRAAILKALAG